MKKLTDEAGELAQNEANDDRGAYSSSSEFDDEGLATETPLSSGCVWRRQDQYERVRISDLDSERTTSFDSSTLSHSAPSANSHPGFCTSAGKQAQ